MFYRKKLLSKIWHFLSARYTGCCNFSQKQLAIQCTSKTHW